MKKIEKKVWPEYFQKILDGVKTFELRLGDFDCKEGNILVLREWDPKTKEYTGREIEKKITYIVKTKKASFWTKEEIEKCGYRVLGFK